MADRLENLIAKIDKKLEDKMILERKTRQLPRGKLLYWYGEVEGYHDFKLQMLDMLSYDSEYLNLSTLKDQIKGKDKAHIMNFLFNVEDVPEAFSVLDMHYGRIEIVLPRLKKKLDENWYEGEIGGKVGMFPTDYVEVTVPLP